jgi:hypothetical protein
MGEARRRFAGACVASDVGSLAETRRKIYDPMAMTLSLPALLFGCSLAALAQLGCSSGLEGVEKRLGSMQDEITKLQNQNDRLVERVDAMEVREAKAEKAAKAAAPVASAERPSLKVVKVVPEDTSGMPSPQVGTPAPGEAADDPSPRPVIKLRGGGKNEGKSSKGEGEG